MFTAVFVKKTKISGSLNERTPNFYLGKRGTVTYVNKTDVLSCADNKDYSNEYSN